MHRAQCRQGGKVDLGVPNPLSVFLSNALCPYLWFTYHLSRVGSPGPPSPPTPSVTPRLRGLTGTIASNAPRRGVAVRVCAASLSRAPLLLPRGSDGGTE